MATLTRQTPIEEMVRVLNEGTKTLKLGFNGRVYTVEPGKESFIPAECAVIHFGDWEARGERRADEVKRIRGLYGALPGMKREVLEPDGTVKEITDIELWDRNRPKAKVLLLDGTEAATVVDDPEGENLGAPSAEMAESEKVQHLQAQMQRMQTLLEEVMAQQGPSDVETDSPANAPRRTRTVPKVTGPRPDELEV